jgi:predicted MPP superfamily phosphohydrolase
MEGIQTMAQKSGFVGTLIGFLSKLVLLVVLVLTVALIWGLVEEPGQLRLTQAKLKSAQWPVHWQPIDVVVVSDLHVGSRYVDLDKLATIVDLVNRMEPEVVVLLGSFMPGDFFKTPITPAEFAPVLGRLNAEFGVYALFGRRDPLDGGKPLADALKQQNITVLSNSAAPVKLAQEKRFWIAGFENNPAAYQKLTARLPEGEPVIGLVHNPARFPEIPPRVDVVFAGYTHGGLVNIPEVPFTILPTGVPDRYAYGLVREGNRQMFVTAGVGTDEYPLRLNNKPEILIATILPEQ